MSVFMPGLFESPILARDRHDIVSRIMRLNIPLGAKPETAKIPSS